MMSELQGYLGELGRQLHLAPHQERDILRELQGHLEERAEEFRAQGLPPSEAARRAMGVLGVPQEMARRMYAIHSRTTWREALLAATPHIAFAILFAMHLWTQVLWVGVVLAMATLVSLRGWRRNRSPWLYPWLSYSLAVPIISGIAAAGALGYGVWSFFSRGETPLGMPIYLLLALYVPFALWLVGSLATRVVRQDWLLASLTAMPFPLLVSWYLFFQEEGRAITAESPRQLQQADSNTALVFLALAITTAIFCRVGQRVLRILLLISATPVLTFFAYLTYMGNPGTLTAVLVVVACVTLLISPAFLESRLGHQETWRVSSQE